ncbi:hypothetical protein ACQBAT_06265 [Ornithinimicrobium sp. Y1847]|uniref:hypothetical protein n=1 Tax=Ornithinimicrobium sp. Y1847 TaxID=3405419 RepID=UPI003B670E9A
MPDQRTTLVARVPPEMTTVAEFVVCAVTVIEVAGEAPWTFQVVPTGRVTGASEVSR